MSIDTNPWSCWVAYYPDYSNIFVFSTEIEALRYAVEHADMRVKQLTNGEELR